MTDVAFTYSVTLLVAWGLLMIRTVVATPTREAATLPPSLCPSSSPSASVIGCPTTSWKS